MDMECRRESGEVNRKLGIIRPICRTGGIRLPWRTSRAKLASEVFVVGLDVKKFSPFTTKSMLNCYIPDSLPAI